MNLIALAVKKPILVIAMVVLIVLFGLLALYAIPIQLTPDINRPVIQVTTIWPGTAPVEVEREIINRQEEQLKGLEGVKEIISLASTGQAQVTLEFHVGQDMDKALLLVANRLDRVTGYPEEADEPILTTAGSEDSPIAWVVLKQNKQNTIPVHALGDFADDVIRSRLERVPGVGRVNVFGGSEREMQIIVKAEQLAHYRLTITDLLRALRDANVNISAGDVEEGKRRYVIRTQAEFEHIGQAQEVVIKSQTDAQGRQERITIADIADVRFGYKKPTALIRHLGEPIIAINAVRETGANVIETMRGLKAGIEELNDGLLKSAGLYLTQVYDETIYIDSAIHLVQTNIIVGGLLAATILILFLKSWRAVLIISLAIPISVIGAFVAMAALGRSINVISLAGLAFAVGMVVDAAIIVLENIYRLRFDGKPAKQAAIDGTQQVWGAILVSAVTTVAVFVPILMLKVEVGQLFRDIAVAISVAVCLSLLVAVTLIPTLSAKLFQGPMTATNLQTFVFVDRFGQWFSALVIQYLQTIFKRPKFAVMSVLALTLMAGIGTALLLPKLEYLPEGNRNFIFGIILPPPGYNLATTKEISDRVENAARPLWSSETGPEAAPGQPPKIKNFFFVARENLSFVGAISEQPQRAKELIPVLSKPVFREPGTFGFISQPSIFGRGIGSGRSIDLDIIGPDLEVILNIALQTMIKLSEVLPTHEGNQYRPNPGLELGAPEVRIIPNYLRLADNGLTARDLALAVKVFNEGLRISELTLAGKRRDLTLKGPEQNIVATQEISNLPVITQQGEIVPVGNLADVMLTAGPTELRHKDRVRAVTIEIRPAPFIPLEQSMELIQQQVLTPLQKELPLNVNMRLSGTADELTQTWNAMVWQLGLALVIVYLVMAILFDSFFYPLIILFSVPVATFGGIVGLALLNLFVYQPLDMLTMLGFIILVGIVVNNAILLVHHTLYNVRKEHMPLQEAVITATKHRIRPIFMSTLTSIFGMLPLVLFPGAGSELYRGLGSVVVGGLTLSAILTLIMIPALLRFSSPIAKVRDQAEILQ